MPLTDDERVETIEEGGGRVTEGDIHLLFEDAERLFAELVSASSKMKYEMYKLRQKLENLLDIFGSSDSFEPNGQGKLAGPGLPVRKVVQANAGPSDSAKQRYAPGHDRGKAAAPKAEATASGKAFSSKKKEG